jgi:cobalt/nickel transport system permease protein
MRAEEVFKPRKLVDGDLNVFFSLLSLLIVTVSTGAQIAGLIIFSFLAIYASWKRHLKILAAMLPFVLPGMLAIYLTSGLQAALLTGLRCFASVSILSYVVITTTISELFASLKRLKLPDFFVEIATLVYRAIQVLLDEASRMEVAASSRLGFSRRKTFLKTAALISYSVFDKAMKRAAIMQLAMEARCYSGKMPLRSRESRGWFIALPSLCIIIAAWWFL